ncbi:hypothetical protein CALCODRAFT_486351 [Calocera cornea HHB12733]|uniref:Amidoligase enzyme n=1 Tax=Calocera cornea HHB12733 TaxID=1353952 RepID=A0A165DSJ1_9BASI|nr:hypothetical protein CALCODRAFT_486351 [Calocera cornea HHB12733]
MARKLSIGFEIECLALLDAPSSDAVPLIMDLINNTTVHHARDNTFTYPSNETKWRVVDDPSIKSLDVLLRSVELVAPPVEDLPGTDIPAPSTGRGWRRALQEVLRAVKESLTLEVNLTTGLHVHIGPGLGCTWEIRHLRKIALVFLFFEDQLDQWHAPHRSDNTLRHNLDYLASMRQSRKCADLRDDQLSKKILGARDWKNLAEWVNPCPFGVLDYSRNYKVNFTSVGLHGTVEFRQHEGTTCVRSIIQWGEMLLALVRLAIRSDEGDLLDLCLAKVQLKDLVALAKRTEGWADMTTPVYVSPTAEQLARQARVSDYIANTILHISR